MKEGALELVFESMPVLIMWKQKAENWKSRTTENKGTGKLSECRQQVWMGSKVGEEEMW